MKSKQITVAYAALALLCTNFTSCSPAQKEKDVDQIFNYTTEKGADLVFLKRRVDFGKVNNDSELFARFDFVNTGTENLVVDKVLSDCSCSVSRISKQIVAPKDSAFITVKLDTEHKKGKVKIYSTVYTNTPTRLYSLEVMADVYEENK
jgi:hypothetical protein